MTFFLYGNDIGGTAYFDPRSRSIIHYKMHRYFLISCWAHDQWGVKHFSCGKKREASGSVETLKKTENGELSGEASAWGSPHFHHWHVAGIAGQGNNNRVLLDSGRHDLSRGRNP